MKISAEELNKLFYDEGKTIGEIAKIFGITEYELKRVMKYTAPTSRVKKCQPNLSIVRPPDNGGGMSFELTKD